MSTLNHKLLRGYRLDQRRRGLLDSTINRRDRSLRTFSEWLAPRPLTAATTEEIEQFLDGRDLAAKGRYVWISLLHCFYEWAIRAGETDHDPTAVIIRPKLRKRLPRPVSDQSLELALEQTADADLRAWVVLAAFAGFRCIEIANLEHDGLIDTPDGLVLQVVGKGDKERVVPAHPQVVAALERHGIPRRGRMFVHPSGRPWTPAQVSGRANRHLREIGVPETFHQFRHWFGTRVYAEVRDLRVTQELMGHDHPVTTTIYTDWSRTDARRAVLALGTELGLPAHCVDGGLTSLRC